MPYSFAYIVRIMLGYRLLLALVAGHVARYSMLSSRT